MQVIKKIAGISLIVGVYVIAGFAQEKSAYSKNGLSFEYLPGWEVKEKDTVEGDQITLANSETDSQITVIAVKKLLNSKDPAEARTRVVDNWLNTLKRWYEEYAKLSLTRTDTKRIVAGQTVDAVDFTFEMDRQPGKVEACWVMFDKKLVLLYMVRPDKMAEKANIGWEAVRGSIRYEKKK